MKSPNFQFLKSDAHLLRLAAEAETLCLSSPDLALMRMRQLLECMLKSLSSEKSSIVDLINELRYTNVISPQIADAMHRLRKLGNAANHEAHATQSDALLGLKVSRLLAIWFHTLSNPNFKPTAFVPPPAGEHPSEQLASELSKLNEELATQKDATLAAQQKAGELEIAKKEAEALAKQQYADLQAAMELAEESEQKLQQAQDEFLKQLSEREESDSKITQQAIDQAQDVFDHEMDEGTTRKLIDQQLSEAGWEADSVNLRYSKGTRPKHGRNLAIAEYPTSSGPADYILFIGLTPVAAVEAKRNNVDVAGKIPQAERYSSTFKTDSTHKPAYEIEGRSLPWSDSLEGHYHLPFAYSTNGRPYLAQLKEKSGTWFRDLREPSNIKRPLQDFHSPDGLIDLLKRNRQKAQEKLQQEGFDYLKLRDYQQKAIQKVESALESGQTSCLLAMATGTGKTRTIIGLIYRFLKAERFKRILFLVDRTALGTQALDAFGDAPLEANQRLSTIYNIAELGDMAPEAEDRVQVATVQAMVARLFRTDDPLNIDTFDCIIVDEAHRGYTLDQEMTDGELSNRDAALYLSSYRRVIDYFDAVKIGLTATPAKHTSDIFGKPVYTYTYREAVADDWLIDHDPPIRYETFLSKHGIKFDKGDTVSVVNTKTRAVETAELEDEVVFDVSAFNSKVITKSFNEVICKELAKEIDPNSQEKTLIFCARDTHADMVKTLLDEAFLEIHGEFYNEASVRKITGTSDQVSKLIKRFKNETFPSVVITVDLLTTGIDVPKITHLVFLRRVKSRILYEQMIGRATRRCDEIGKTAFKIYDPVDLYSTLQKVSTMKPLVKNPNISLKDLIAELQDPQTHVTASAKPEEKEAAPAENDTLVLDAEIPHAEQVLDQISQKLMRVLRKATKKAETNQNVQQKLTELEDIWQVPASELHQHVRKLGPVKAAQWFENIPQIINQIESVKELIGTEYFPIISDYDDRLTLREESYGGHKKPDDYLTAFTTFIKDNINESAALSACVTSPGDLTRVQLKEVVMLLDQHGYNKATLGSAWKSKTNHAIAASIIGYIRQAALGSELISFQQRVDTAMGNVYSLHPWSTMQRKWLDRLAKQLTFEIIIDETFINKAFADQGGAQRLNIQLGKHLDEVLTTIARNLWTA